MREMGRTVTAGDCLAPPPTCSSKNVWRKAQCPCRCHAMSVRLPSVSLPGPLASLRITVCWGGVRQILPTHPGIWAPSRCTRCQPSCDWLWCQRAARCQMRRGIKSSIRSRIQYLHGIYASPPCDLSDLLCQSKKINMWYWFWKWWNLKFALFAKVGNVNSFSPSCADIQHIEEEASTSSHCRTFIFWTRMWHTWKPQWIARRSVVRKLLQLVTILWC